jgi:hypothetical protein
MGSTGAAWPRYRSATSPICTPSGYRESGSHFFREGKSKMATGKAKETQSTEIEKRQMFDPNDLRGIQSFEDALRVLEAAGVPLADAQEVIGDGFEMCEDKSVLVNQPMVILAWLFAPGDYVDDRTGEKSEFAIMRLVTGAGQKFVVTDGSTGLAAQLRDYESRTGRMGGLLVKRGFRKSEYDNEFGHGTTFYLNV